MNKIEDKFIIKNGNKNKILTFAYLTMCNLENEDLSDETFRKLIIFLRDKLEISAVLDDNS
jgi:hypothetical protein